MDSYICFINDLTELLPNINNDDCIVSAYLGGSASRGDYVVGISDIDIYLVVKNYDKNDSINNTIQNMAKNMLPDLLSWCPDGVTVAFTSYQDIKSGTSWLGSGSEYFEFQKTGKLLYGRDIKHEIVVPNEIDIIKSSEQAINEIKQIIKQDLSNVSINKYFVRCVFGTAFSAIYFYMCMKRQYIRGKEKTTDAYCKQNTANASIAKDILSLWHIFSRRELSKAEIFRLIDETKNIINSI